MSKLQITHENIEEHEFLREKHDVVQKDSGKDIKEAWSSLDGWTKGQTLEQNEGYVEKEKRDEKKELKHTLFTLPPMKRKKT